MMGIWEQERNVQIAGECFLQIRNTKNPLRLPYSRKRENHAVRNQIHLRNGLRNRIMRKRQSKLRERVILAGKVYLKITLFLKTPRAKIVKLHALSNGILENQNIFWTDLHLLNEMRNIHFTQNITSHFTQDKKYADKVFWKCVAFSRNVFHWKCWITGKENIGFFYERQKHR